MMSSKCGFCKKSVYPNDSHLNLNEQKYHTGCAKCADCKCQITLANFTKSGELLLCKTHYNERFSTTGSFAGGEKFKKTAAPNTAPVVPVNIAPVLSSTPAREEPLSEKAESVKDKLSKFGAGVNSANKCAVCTKSVYPNDPQLVLDGNKYHLGCAKCTDCQCQINTSNFTRDGSTLYCKTHYIKRFKEQGKFVGEDKFARKRGDINADFLAGHAIMTGGENVNPPEPPTDQDEKAKQEEEESIKQRAAEEEARLKAEEEAKHRAEEETKKRAEEEAAQLKAEEEAKKRAEEEAAQLKAEQESTNVGTENNEEGV